MKLPSYVSGISDVPLLGETIGQHFDRMAQHWPDREALVSRQQGIRWSYAELEERSNHLAAGLLALGLKTGDRVGIWSPNNSQWVQLQIATAKAGLILVTVNPAYRQSELEHVLKISGCKALVSASHFKTTNYLETIRALAPTLTRSHGVDPGGNFPELRHIIHLADDEQAGMTKFAEVEALGREAGLDQLETIASGLQFDDPINIQFTSGTTGSPKGATLTHHNILNNAYFVGRTMGLGEGDRLCVPVPLYHCFGMVMSVLSCITRGATMVFPAESFEPRSVLETIQGERCTHLHGVPTMFIAELQHPDFDKFDLSTLRGGIMAGSPCPIEIMRQVNDKMHMTEVTIAYGMTETSPVSFQSQTDDPVERRVSTVGRVMPHIEVKIVDADGRVAPRGESGELLTRGYSVMRGYWNEPQRTAEVLDEAGWMHTGDLAVIDDEGYCNIVGRLKDLVIRGGENIYPREIEEFLFRHPDIESVQVFGVPDAKFGEELCAWVKVRTGRSLTEDEVKAFCRDQIAHYKIPRYVQFVDDFPMTVTGKAQKFIMRDQASKALGLSEIDTA